VEILTDIFIKITKPKTEVAKPRFKDGLNSIKQAKSYHYFYKNGL